MTNEVLEGAEDIVLIRPASDKGRYVFAVAPNREFKKRQFDMTLNPAEGDVNAFSGHWGFNEQTGEITGSSTFLGLRFDKTIRPLGLWVPGVLEARVLDGKGKLTNGVYRDNGMWVYSSAKPNQDIAQSLVERASREGWELPIFASFRDLDYQINPKAQYGVNVSFVQNPSALIKGKDAEKVLSQFNWKGNAGALRSNRNNDGDWLAYWYGLANSNGNGRVGDWICGEAARAELESAYDALSERHGSKIRELESARKVQGEAFRTELGVK